ncbi:ammonium transporter [Pseudobacteriovorax antillogorgiicola]|uniref:histidine kinase n=2 Tax=Pseudobacteriovorax antillogorgiicola TaxID=1513793 RepID=A0A1Y6CMC3_9BACT|nr:ammonium transporter [Pseudobacteriovorax antillogorgiicola]SMF77499.1 ammonium transporter [Pseudobacteriovorax antillogorgiicola]
MLVFGMQIGFLAIESGLTRPKNSISVAAKNIIDGMLSFLLFWILGWGIMEGSDYGGLIGFSEFWGPANLDNETIAKFVFFALFCCTSTTIVSGAIAERVNIKSYLYITILVSGLIFPIIAHWVWHPQGLLSSLGFVDYAGSTVVHGTGGFIALVAAYMVGPRTGRFSADGKAWKGSQLPMSAAGCLLLCLGFLGFNGGSGLALNQDTWRVILITLLCISGGLLGGVIQSVARHGLVSFNALIVGPLSGAVASCAFCPWLDPTGAIALGGIAGVLAGETGLILEKRKIDDVVGAVPVHLVGGLVGSILGALFVDSELFSQSRWQTLGIQAIGSVVHGTAVVGVAWLTLKFIDRWQPLRVPIQEELEGLNYREHGKATRWGDLVQFINWQREHDLTLEARARVDEFSEEGQVAAQLNLLLDDINKREQALELAKNLAEQANRAKSKFLSTTSHELRTPLNAIIGYSEMLAEDLQNSSYHEDIDRIKQSGTYLLSLINDMLDISRLDSGRFKMQANWVILEDFAAEIESLTLPLTKKQMNSLSVEVKADAKQLYFDPVRLKQVLMNLLGNACKFTEKGTVKLLLEESRGSLRCQVEDSGRGLTPSEIKRIFKPFEQALRIDSLSGTGLGLTISQGIVKEMGGTIAVESKVGHGSCFSFKIDVKKELELADDRLMVLLVDDDPGTRLLVREYLNELGFQVDQAASVVEACAKLETGSYRMVITDYIFPDDNGGAIVQRVRDQGLLYPVLIITGFADKIVCGENVSILAKPFDLEQLCRALTNLNVEVNEKASRSA